MIIAAMIGYYVFAAGVLALVGFATARQNVRRFKALTDEAIAHLRTVSAVPTPKGKGIHSPHVWLSDSVIQEAPFDVALPAARRPYVLLTIKLHPEVTTQLPVPFWGALLLSKVDDLEKGLGGGGVRLDVSGSTETATTITIKLVPKKATGASQRLAELRDRLMEWKQAVKDKVRADQDNDLNRLAESEIAGGLDSVSVCLPGADSDTAARS